MSILKDATKDIDTPIDIPSGLTDWYRKGKVKVIIFYPDISYTEHFMSFRKGTTFVINEKRYIIVPETIVKGKKFSSVRYYYDNPFPIRIGYQRTPLRKDVNFTDRDPITKEVKVYNTQVEMNSTVYNDAMTTKVFADMYRNNSWLTPKNLIIIMVALLVVVLIYLQLSGQVDILGKLGIGG